MSDYLDYFECCAIEGHPGAPQVEVDLIKNIVSSEFVPNGDSIDLCAAHSTFFYYPENIDPSSVVVVDYSPQLLEYNKSPNRITADISMPLDINTNTFLNTTMFYGARYQQNWNLTLSEMYRITREDGKLMIIDYTQLEGVDGSLTFDVDYTCKLLKEIGARDVRKVILQEEQKNLRYKGPLVGVIARK